MPGAVDKACSKLSISLRDPPRPIPPRDIVDAGFLQLVRYGILAANDPLVLDSLRVVDASPKSGHTERSVLASLQP